MVKGADSNFSKHYKSIHYSFMYKQKRKQKSKTKRDEDILFTNVFTKFQKIIQNVSFLIITNIYLKISLLKSALKV